MQAYPAFREVLEARFKGKPIEGIEIGVLGGSWTSYMLTFVPNLKILTCIDPWFHFVDKLYERGHPQSVHDINFRDYESKVRPFKQEGRKIRTLKMSSDEAVKLIKQPVDFIYIDGCHDYEFIKRDIANYYPLVKPGGILAGHDYGLAEGVTKAVDERFSKEGAYPRVTVLDDYVWWVEKY